MLAVPQRDPGLSVAGMATQVPSLRAVLRTADPDLAILDWDLCGYAPVWLLAEVKRHGRCPQVTVRGRDEWLRQVSGTRRRY